MTLSLNVLKLQTFFILMSHDFSALSDLGWEVLLLHPRDVNGDGKHLGAQLGGNLQDGPIT